MLSKIIEYIEEIFKDFSLRNKNNWILTYSRDSVNISPDGCSEEPYKYYKHKKYNYSINNSYNKRTGPLDLFILIKMFMKKYKSHELLYGSVCYVETFDINKPKRNETKRDIRDRKLSEILKR